MKTFRVGLSQRIRNADGSPAIPEWDLSGLIDDRRIECVNLPEGPLMGPSDIAGLDALVLFLERIAADSFPDDGRLSLIARYGVGYDTIDVPACTRHRVALAIAPDGVRRPVAMSVITLMLALTMRLKDKDRIARQGPAGWLGKTDYNGMGLTGRTLGAVGVGNIGAEVFRLAQPFGMRFIAHDPYADAEFAASLGVELLSLEELFRSADVLTVHCPLTDATRHLVGEPLLRLMKPVAYFINTARGPIVDQAALTRVLQEGAIAGAGIDVFEQEPPDPDDPILRLDNVVLSPHALCFTDECLAGIGAADVRAVHAVIQGRVPDAVVNREVLTDAAFKAKLARYAAAYE